MTTKMDYAGNNRVVINQAGSVQQVNHYYAFGGLFGEGAQTVKQRYKYNGKELDTKVGLNMYDYGARHYDAALGRWFTVDPLAEKYYGISPFVYVANNPVNLIDPNGIWIDDYSINEKERRITIIKQDEKVDRVFDKDNPKGKVIEKGSFDIEKYRNEGYRIETLVPAGMSITDLGLSIFTGEMAVVKVGAWIGKDISTWRASSAAKVVETSAEVSINAAKASTNVVEQVAAHGNSLKSLRPTWGYKLYSQDGIFLKNGITSKLVPQSRYTRAFMSDKIMVPIEQFPNRLGAWQWEFQQNQILRGPLNLNMH